jgi:hypothetical protein
VTPWASQLWLMVWWSSQVPKRQKAPCEPFVGGYPMPEQRFLEL